MNSYTTMCQLSNARDLRLGYLAEFCPGMMSRCVNSQEVLYILVLQRIKSIKIL
jgi:hypothetical protein